MIDGAAHFTYLGFSRRARGVMLVFQEGMLILVLERPGWGVMRKHDLANLLPHTHADASSSSAEEPGSDNDAYVFAASSSDTLDTSTPHGSSSGTNAPPQHLPEPSPRPSASSSSTSSDDEEMDWAPPAAVLGWHPSEAPVCAGPVTAQSVQTFRSLGSTHEVQTFVSQLQANHWEPQPAGNPGRATLVALQAFGKLSVLVWQGIWRAAGNVGHQHMALTPALACQFVEHAVVAPARNLSAVPDAELNTCEFQLNAGAASALVFDRGVLVQTHPDARLVGWHAFGEYGRTAIVCAADADLLQAMCDLNPSPDHPALRLFFFGNMDVPEGHGPCVTVVHSHKLSRFVCLRLEPSGPLLRAGDPHCPASAAVLQALRHMRPALVHDSQDVRGPLGLASGSWQVPLILGAIQCIDATVDVPGLIGTTWHDTVQPVVEKLLLLHRPQESTCLANGTISQPIDPLIDLMRRDVCLRRPEVKVLWPVDLLADLLKTLAPQHPAHVVKDPKVADVDLALRQPGCTLFVFQQPGPTAPSIVLAQGNRCWSGQAQFSLATLKTRLTQALAHGPGERLLVLAFVA